MSGRDRVYSDPPRDRSPRHGMGQPNMVRYDDIKYKTRTMMDRSVMGMGQPGMVM